MFHHQRSAFAFAGALLFASNLRAADSCKILLAEKSSQPAAVQRLVDSDPYRQWLAWEQQANLSRYRKQAEAVVLPLVPVQSSDVQVQANGPVPQVLLKALQLRKTNILWPQHPFNQSSLVPFWNRSPEAYLQADLTASRSLALQGSLRGFTIKLATDHPHGTERAKQSSKINTNEDIATALLHTEHIANIDAHLGSDSYLKVLPEILTISEKQSGIGAVVRDCRSLDDGNYYLPASSIAFVGRQIALVNQEMFQEFFSRHFAEALGRAKAHLLLRYGLQMMTPNSQNFLIQLDAHLKPTGKIIFRDISDASYVLPVATGLGFEQQMNQDAKLDFPPEQVLKPFWSDSVRFFDKSGPASIPKFILDSWGHAHNAAYLKVLRESLGLQIPEPDLYEAPADSFKALYHLLASPEGQQALRQYSARAFGRP